MSETKPPTEHQNVLQKMANAVVTGVKDGTEAIVEGTQKVAGVFADGGKAILGGINQATHIVADQATGVAGYVKDGIFYVGDKAVEGSVLIKDGVLTVGETVVGSIINTGKFIGDEEYRNQVGIPWLKDVIESNRQIIAYQMQQNSKAMGVLYRYSLGQELNPDEVEIATKQLTDMAKLVPALAIFLLPGGGILLPILAKLLPWEVIPDLKPPEESKVPVPTN